MTYSNSPLFDLLRSAQKPKKRIFISFIYDDDNRYFNLLHAWSKNKDFDLEFYSESVREAFDSQNADYIKGQITPKIQRASITLCLASQNTHSSRWVNWEIEESIKQSNELIAVNTTQYTVNLPPAFNGQKYIGITSFNYSEIKTTIDRL